MLSQPGFPTRIKALTIDPLLHYDNIVDIGHNQQGIDNCWLFFENFKQNRITLAGIVQLA
jgi:hypothetical protein